MEKKTKVLPAVLCVILLVTVAVAGTLAYLSHKTETSRNVFTIGNVDITIDERKADGSGRTSKGNKYVLKSGKIYHKDPIIHVDKKSDSSYIFVKVKNEISHLENKNNLVSHQILKNGWKEFGDYKQGNTRIYWKKWNKPQIKKDNYYDLQLFETVHIDKNTTEKKLSEAANKSIVITAYAVQQKSIKDEVTAWNILKEKVE